MRWLLFILLLGCSNSNKPAQQVSPPDSLSDLKIKYTAKLKEAEQKRTADGWLATDECDSALFTGKYSCAAKGVNFKAAEYPETPGRFNRRPPPFCEAGFGSATSWSRDMGMGLLAYAWCNQDLELMKRHAAFGKENSWRMGEPFTPDGRVVYSPAMIGNVYQVIFAMGGEDNVGRIWDNVYPAGLVDYPAHLQMVNIWLRSEIDDYKLLDHIKDSMLERIKEHALRENLCPMYQAMAAKYVTGDYAHTIDVLLSESYACEYYHEDSREDDVFLAEWLFAAWFALKELQALPMEE